MQAAIRAGERRFLEPARSRLSAREEALWCLLALLAAFLSLAPGHQPWFAADSYQYLSVAQSIAQTGRAATSIVHFDVERHRAVIPAPSTTFPPGYPALLAAFERLGLRGESAGAAISILSFVGVIPVLIRMGRYTGLRGAATRAVLLLWVVNSEAAHAAGCIATEMPFTLASCGALALIAVGTRNHPRAFYCGMALAGAAYHLRYAGLFLVLTLVLFEAGLSLWGWVPWRRAAVGIAMMLAIVGAGMLRNVIVTGTWRGGNEKRMANGVMPTLKTYVTSLYHVLFGENPVAKAWWFAVLIVVGLLLVVAAAYAARASFSAMFNRTAIDPTSLLLVTYGAIYSAGMVYAGVTSVVSFGTRMFVPLVPVLLLLICLALDSLARLRLPAPWSTLRIVAFLCLGIAYAGENVVSARGYHEEAPHVLVDRELSEPVFAPRGAKVSMRAWIDAHIPGNEILVAADGQPTAYVLHRRTVSVLGPWFSSEQWDARFLHQLMQRYHARHLLIYTGALGEQPEEERGWPLFQQLLRGDVPQWLKAEAESRTAEVFECADCAPASGG